MVVTLSYVFVIGAEQTRLAIGLTWLAGCGIREYAYSYIERKLSVRHRFSRVAFEEFTQNRHKQGSFNSTPLTEYAIRSSPITCIDKQSFDLTLFPSVVFGNSTIKDIYQETYRFDMVCPLHHRKSLSVRHRFFRMTLRSSPITGIDKKVSIRHCLGTEYGIQGVRPLQT
ncbi:hypothetical protein CEXT_734451 [Caerostris extrusa]|uniref:Uncharacterized protein n=1 Tax=Caerostris extrusa TaxID=172846 RepID=A0AAV4X010_CAEEX|nr:hypothetical protein CEXT_734451 [Caerostris extrusa]